MMLQPQIIVNMDGSECFTSTVSYDLVKRRIVYLNGEVNAETALLVSSQLRYLAARSDGDIYLYINSHGGSVSDGLMIYDVMNEIPCDVVTVAAGMAASMGAFLLAAGAPGKRYAAPSAQLMIHQPLGGVQGQATDISLVAERIQNIKKNLAGIMAEKCGKKEEAVIRDMERDHWMSAYQAKEYGLVDQVGFPPS